MAVTEPEYKDVSLEEFRRATIGKTVERVESTAHGGLLIYFEDGTHVNLYALERVGGVYLGIPL